MKKNGSIELIRKYPSPNPNVELEEIVYWSEGLRVKGLLARPIGDGSYEALLYLRGGLQSVGMVRPARIAQFASNGFIVFAPYYRGNRGGEGRDEFGGDDRLDALHSIQLLKEFANNDSVHLFGFSRGGLMALWMGILSKDIRSIVTWSGVADLADLYEERVDLRRTLKRLIGDLQQNIRKFMKNAHQFMKWTAFMHRYLLSTVLKIPMLGSNSPISLKRRLRNQEKNLKRGIWPIWHTIFHPISIEKRSVLFAIG